MSEYSSVARSVHTDAAAGTVAAKGAKELHIGDYVGFERITPSKDWKLSLGKVIGFPSSRTVKVAHYDPVNSKSVTQDPMSEEEVRQKAEETNQVELWHNREAMREDARRARDAEKEASTRLYHARDAVVVRQEEAAQRVMATLAGLDAARRELRAIPDRQWRDLRQPGRPTEDVVKVVRSLLLVLYEDTVTEWEDMQVIMRQPDFMNRLIGWDCTVTPMSLPRRKKILALCTGEEEEPEAAMGAKKRRRSGSRTPGAAAGHIEVPAASSKAGNVPDMDRICRVWLNAQIACSEAARAQERCISDCNADRQEQRELLREVNNMRVGIAAMDVQMLEMKNTILGIDDTPKPITTLEAMQVDTLFYKRTYADADGRFVQEVILRDSIIVNFGPGAEEDTEGYVRLSQAQADYLRTAVISAYIKHDADEMEDLIQRKAREEAELAELKARIDELRAKGHLTAEEEEELAQLEKMYADLERRHRQTLNRIGDLYACGRGAREIIKAIQRPEFKYTRLHCKMSGDWEMILNDPERTAEMEAAFRDDISNLLNIPAASVYDIDARSGSLVIDFTVKHNGDLDDEELQDLVNKGDFSALSMFYEKVTFKKTSPLNTSEQEAAYLESQRSMMPLPISGMGYRETLEDYYNPDGTLDEEFSDEVKNDPDYRVAKITIPPVREDYDAYVITGPVERSVEDAQTVSVN